MNTLTISLLQSALVWENPEANLKYFSQKINTLHAAVDLIVLPEMFTTGFSANVNTLAETMDGNTVRWMQQMAAKKSAAITGSIIIKESFDSDKDSVFYNRLLFVFPSGEIQYYDKRHTFTLAKEHEIFSSGEEKIIIDYKDWKICPLICYDLRFPVWSRNTEDYDILIYTANWPQKRINAWDALLKARAIENMSYTVGVNRIGIDGNKHEYVGHSVVFDYLGNSLSKEKNQEECVITIELHKDEQNFIRKKLGFLNDKDTFKLI